MRSERSAGTERSHEVVPADGHATINPLPEGFSRLSLSPEAHPSEVLHPCRSLALTWQIPGRMLIQTERLALQNFSIRSACICCSKSDRSVPGDEGSHGRRVERVRLSRQERKDTQTMRSDGDTWDIVSSVGLTALAVATFRALESTRPDAIIEDKFASWFVEAAAEPHFTALLKDPTLLEDTPFGGFMGLRTRFFDEFFSSSTESGVRQAVIVAAGLDSRAYRLDWSSGSTVFEVDQPKVLEFKAEVLAAHDAQPKTDRRTVPTDLRNDWPAALEEAGFDPNEPTAWSAEGLLAYLPGPAHDALFERIDELSATGSRLAVNDFPAGTDPSKLAAIRSKYFAKDPFGDLDISQLFYSDNRSDPGQWLAEHNWTVRRFSSVELAELYDRRIPELPEEIAALSTQPSFLAATKN